LKMNVIKEIYPFVSIIIPCRNEEQFIGKCLDSFLANEYPNYFEMEIVTMIAVSP